MTRPSASHRSRLPAIAPLPDSRHLLNPLVLARRKQHGRAWNASLSHQGAAAGRAGRIARESRPPFPTLVSLTISINPTCGAAAAGNNKLN